MFLARKLSQWQRAAIIDAATAERIQAFEASNGKPLLLQALAGLGALTIGIGIISIVAANWSGISYPWKLAAAGLSCALLAVATLLSNARGRVLATEASVLIYYLLTLASVGLLGQIYQTGTPAWQALLLWTAATGPLLLMARTGFGGALGFIGTTMTYAFCVVAGLDAMTDTHAADTAAVAFVGWPLAAVLVAKLSPLAKARPQVAQAVATLGWLLILGAGALLPFAFYVDTHGDHLGWAVPATGAAVAAFLVALSRAKEPRGTTAFIGLSLSVGSAWLIFATGLGVGHDEMGVLGALAQVGYLAVLAWTALQCGRTSLFNIITALIALRVLIIYFEVFGSMLSTGVGMITGGALTLLMAWLWKRSRRSK